VKAGKFIKRLRKAHGMSQRDFADFIGTSQTTISKLERDKTDMPRKKTLKKICKALGLSKSIIYIWKIDLKDFHKSSKGEADLLIKQLLKISIINPKKIREWHRK
jgi:transcriptional regulator with XRE-family HTH domain